MSPDADRPRDAPSSPRFPARHAPPLRQLLGRLRDRRRRWPHRRSSFVGAGGAGLLVLALLLAGVARNDARRRDNGSVQTDDHSDPAGSTTSTPTTSRRSSASLFPSGAVPEPFTTSSTAGPDGAAPTSRRVSPGRGPTVNGPRLDQAPTVPPPTVLTQPSPAASTTTVPGVAGPVPGGSDGSRPPTTDPADTKRTTSTTTTTATEPCVRTGPPPKPPGTQVPPATSVGVDPLPSDGVAVLHGRYTGFEGTPVQLSLTSAQKGYQATLDTAADGSFTVHVPAGCGTGYWLTGPKWQDDPSCCSAGYQILVWADDDLSLGEFGCRRVATGPRYTTTPTLLQPG